MISIPSKILKVALRSRMWSMLLSGFYVLEKGCVFFGINVNYFNLVDDIPQVFSTLLIVSLLLSVIDRELKSFTITVVLSFSF